MWGKLTRHRHLQIVTQKILFSFIIKSMIKFAGPLLSPRPALKLPRGLIYNAPDSHFYNLLDVKNNRFVGYMIAFPRDCTKSSLYFNVEPNAKAFRVYKLKIFEKRKGWGTYLMNFAKRETFKKGCKGRLAVVAYNSQKPPHVFYKKIGLVTKSARQNQILDEYIAKGIEPRYFDAMDMFVPIKAYEKKDLPTTPKKLNFFEKTLQFIDKLFEMI